MGEKITLSEEELRQAKEKAGTPWFDRARPIPIEKIKAYEEAGFSKRQIGLVFGVSATTINRRIREHEQGSVRDGHG